MDAKRRIALVETRTLDTAGNDPAAPQVIRYQLGNHLGSTCLEMDDQAQIISYEEYTPHGSASYQAMRGVTETQKRYRYTGKERDEETGLYYYGARYYAPWLGRWTATDPAGLVDGPGLYTYCKGSSVTMLDPNGRQTLIQRIAEYTSQIELQQREKAGEIYGPVQEPRLPPPPSTGEEGAGASAPFKFPEPHTGGPYIEEAVPEYPAETEEHRQTMWWGEGEPEGSAWVTETFEEYPGYSYSYKDPEYPGLEIAANVALAGLELMAPEARVAGVLAIRTGAKTMTQARLAQAPSTGGARALAEKLAEPLELAGKGRQLKHSPIEVLIVEGAPPTATTPSQSLLRALKESGIAERLGVELIEPPAKRLYIVSGGVTVSPVEAVTVHGGDILRMDLIAKRGAAAREAIGETYSHGVKICDECGYGWDLLPGIRQVNPRSP